MILAPARIILLVQTSLVTSSARVNRVILENNVRPILMNVKTNPVLAMVHVMTSLTTLSVRALKVFKDLTAMKM